VQGVPRSANPRPPRTPTRRYTLTRIPRLDAEKTNRIARELVTGQGFIATGRPEIDAFQMMLSLMTLPLAVAEQIGAVYAEPGTATVPGRAWNGYPIFLAARLIHRDDVPPLLAEWRRLRDLLDTPPAPD
jgi:hypothetical protein